MFVTVTCCIALMHLHLALHGVVKLRSWTCREIRLRRLTAGGPRPRRCAGGGICGVINNNVGLRGSLFITRTAHFSVTRMWHGASHARGAMVEPTATMCVQHYAGSRIIHGSCWKCSSGWHAICLRYSYNSIGQHFNWYMSVARVSRRQLSLLSSKCSFDRSLSRSRAGSKRW